jgi:hypothetical protein
MQQKGGLLSEDLAGDFRQALEVEEERKRVEKFLVRALNLTAHFQPAEVPPLQAAFRARFDECLEACLYRYSACLRDRLPMTRGDACMTELLISIDDLERGEQSQSPEYNRFVDDLLIEKFLLFPPPGEEYD